MKKSVDLHYISYKSGVNLANARYLQLCLGLVIVQQKDLLINKGQAPLLDIIQRSFKIFHNRSACESLIFSLKCSKPLKNVQIINALSLNSRAFSMTSFFHALQCSIVQAFFQLLFLQNLNYFGLKNLVSNLFDQSIQSQPLQLHLLNSLTLFQNILFFQRFRVFDMKIEELPKNFLLATSKHLFMIIFQKQVAYPKLFLNYNVQVLLGFIMISCYNFIMGSDQCSSNQNQLTLNQNESKYICLKIKIFIQNNFLRLQLIIQALNVYIKIIFNKFANIIFVIEQFMTQSFQQSSAPTFSQQFEQQRNLFLSQSQITIQMTKLRAQLTNKVELYKKLQSFKDQLLKKVKELRNRGNQLQTSSKILSDNQKKQYPVFIVRPSFIAQKFITKEIKTVILELGKKFNKLNEFQKMELITYLAKHHQNNDLVQNCLRLLKQKYKGDLELVKKVNEQKIKTLEKKMEIEQLENYNDKLLKQKEYLIDAKKKDKKIYDTLKEEIKIVEKDIDINATLFQGEKKKYLEDFNVAVCRERIHIQYINQLKQTKLASILNDSINDVEMAQKRRQNLKGYLRNKSVAGVLGNVASYRRKNDGVVISASLHKIKTHHKRNTTKTEHSESTAMKTRQSVLGKSQFY